METGCILVWGVVSICRRLLSPSAPSWSLGTHFSAGLLHSVDLSPLEATPPSTHPAKFHVCPHPQGTLSKFTLGQLGSSHGPVNALRVEGGGGRRGWVVRRGTCASTWGKQGVLGKGFQGSPFSHVSLPVIDSEPEFAPFSPGIAHPYNNFYSLA
jgi:hypothetical protein